MSDSSFGRRELFKRAAAAGAGVAAAGVGLRPALAQDAGTPDVPLLDKVPRRTLGKTGETIPILFMGGSQKFDPTYDKMLHRAYKMGINYIDTAEAYANGQSHVTLKPFIEQVGRENLWITSKSGMFRGSGAAPVSMYRDAIMKEFDVLGTDYLDAYFFHGLRHIECLGPEYIAFADELKKSGKAKYFGFSCHDGNVVDLLNKAAELGSDAINIIMFRYNFAQYGDAELNKAMDACVNAGIGLLGMKTQSSVPTDNEFVQKFQSQNFSLHQARLKAAWADERISGCVSGMTNMQIMMENATAARSVADLTATEVNQLQRYASETAHLNCKGCTHICESRVAGDLRIGEHLRYLMYAECYGEKDGARDMYAALSPSERDFGSVDLAEATRACPQGIDIRARLETARSVLA
jgi:predicted aldo/keto reductase-like oxidoreductase